jgi:hypothetical protein
MNGSDAGVWAPTPVLLWSNSMSKNATPSDNSDGQDGRTDQQSKFDGLHGLILADEDGEVEIEVRTCSGQLDEEKRSDETVAVTLSLLNEETGDAMVSFSCTCTPVRAREMARALAAAAAKMEQAATVEGTNDQ